MAEKEKRNEYTDFANVETQQNYLVAEEFPEGPYGSPINQDKPVENKSTPWKEGQRYYSNFTYENRTLHQDLPRQFPGAHPPHDDKDTDHELPYTKP
ncbi:cytosolic protein [Bacillus sp. Marseille-P3661]|uniref:cytosolic protein n=1 Tax=Bacillus sp. Marseille-P3661 TaxID=1936234 RepID=UPI000C84AC17|nr:cytosolic protein [Bacillus sp. Marseille-P3661]